MRTVRKNPSFQTAQGADPDCHPQTASAKVNEPAAAGVTARMGSWAFAVCKYKKYDITAG